MKTKIYLSLVLLMCFTACDVVGSKSGVKIDKYFDLVSLLDQQTEVLFDQGKSLEKKLTANGATETLKFFPEGIGKLREELALFYEADINKLGLGDAYFTEEISESAGNKKVIYTAKKSGPKVRMIEYDYSSDLLSQIRILMEDENDVYSFEKEMLMRFETMNGRQILSNYRITGKQQMVMKSDLDFVIEGRFIN